MKETIDNLTEWAASNNFVLISEGGYWCFGNRWRLTFINTEGQLYEYRIRQGGEVDGGVVQNKGRALSEQ